MSKKINILIDASGSLKEDDKNVAVNYLLNGIFNVIRNNSLEEELVVKLFQWGKETKQIRKIDSLKINFEGKTTVDGLEKIKKGIKYDVPLILISDGNYTREEMVKLKELSGNILTIFIGADANINRLRDTSSNKIVYSLVDFMQALCDV